MRRKLEEPGICAQWEQRSQIIEPRFAQLKQHDGFRRWTVWGLEGVRTQWSLLCATLNLRVLYKRWQTKVRGGLARAAAVVGRLQAGIKAFTSGISTSRSTSTARA
jgi:hypothetical protein